jgi:hypothetical protein
MYKHHAREIEQAVQLAVQEALLDHKRTGDPIAIWRDGKVQWLPPDQIPMENPHANK